MTISIEHSLPPELVIADGSLFGTYRPGNIISYGDTGLRRSRSYGEHNLASYALQFTPSNYTTKAYEQLMALMNSTAVNGFPFWIKEPISKTRFKVPGELTDGVRTTFINPLDTENVDVAIGGEITEIAITHHASANLLADYVASPDDEALDGSPDPLTLYGSGTLSIVSNPTLSGRTALYQAAGGGSDMGCTTSSTGHAPVVAGQMYTVGMSALCGASYTCRIYGTYLDSGYAPIESYPYFFDYDEKSGSAGDWVHPRVGDVAPVGAAWLQVTASRYTSGSVDNVFDCLMAAPGDFERWFLPSNSPRLIEFASAPAAGKRLTFSTSTACQRWTRVATEREQQLASVELLGHVTAERMSVREVLFP